MSLLTSPTELSRRASLIVTARGASCAIPAVHVLETMRPLPIEPIADAPPFVLGLSVVRGAPVPVVDLGALVTGHPALTMSRFVSVKLGERRVALAVTAVLGLRDLDEVSAMQWPSLLGEARAEVIEAIGVLDEHLLLVLRASRLVPEEIWRGLPTREATT
jgi:purine-binding chemotaxis protein CheW